MQKCNVPLVRKKICDITEVALDDKNVTRSGCEPPAMYKARAPSPRPPSTMAARVEVAADDLVPTVLTTTASPSSHHVHPAQAFLHNLNDDELRRQSQRLVCDVNQCIAELLTFTMLPNYSIAPLGAEHGAYLAIDLGGLTLRVAAVVIDPPSSGVANRSDRVHNVIEQLWIIPNDKKTLNMAFFHYIADRIADILSNQSHLDITEIINTGITWSFPLETTQHNRGRIRLVSKGYTIADDVYGRDLKDILEQVMHQRHQVNLDVKCIINDSLAVYLAGAFYDPYMRLALVLGTGTNVCCSLDVTPDMPATKTCPGESQVLFNTEISVFGDGFIGRVTNKYDEMIDDRFHTFCNRFRPFFEVDPLDGRVFQPHELMTLGRYVPELARLVICDLTATKQLFQLVMGSFERLSVPYDGFSGETMCCIDEKGYPEIVAHLSKEYGWDPLQITRDDVVILKVVCGAIIKRAAFIVALIIVAFVKLLSEHNHEQFADNRLDVGYVGLVLVYFHNYKRLVTEYVNHHSEIQRRGLTVELILIENSSIIGAAIGAAYYSHKQA